MAIDTRYIDTPEGSARVTISREEEYIADVRDVLPEASDADVTAWKRGYWQFVSVLVERLRHCATCHQVTDVYSFDSLGMVMLGEGDGWTVTVDDLINTYPVPDMIAGLEIREG